MLHAFAKKFAKMPAKELKTTRERIKEVQAKVRSGCRLPLEDSPTAMRQRQVHGRI